MSNLFIPSYAQGFARNAAESENPGLWRGLAGLWMPSLGPTGLTLRDWSGYGNHGTLTSMDPATDWVTSEKGWVLDYDGSNDVVECGVHSRLQPTGSWSIVCRSYWRSQVGYRGLVTVRTIDVNSFYLMKSTSSVTRVYGGCNAGGTWYSASTDIPALNEWVDLVGLYRAHTQKVETWVNGIKTEGNGPASFTCASNQPFAIGELTRTGEHFNGKISNVVLYDRDLSPNEIQQLHIDPHALVQPRRRVFAAAAAAVGNPWYAYQQMTAG